MDIFIKKYQPDKYESWVLNGNSLNAMNSCDKRKQRTNSLINALTAPLHSDIIETKLKFKNCYLEKLRNNYVFRLEDEKNSLNESERKIYQNKCRQKILAEINSKNLIFLLNNHDLALHLKNYSKKENLNLTNLCSITLSNYFNSNTCSNNDKQHEEKSNTQENYNYVVNLKSDLVLSIKKDLTIESSNFNRANICDASVDQKNLAINQKIKLQNKKCESAFLNSNLSNSFFEKTNGIWSFQNHNECELNKRIIKFNQMQSLVYPHCSICLLFKTESQESKEKTLLLNQIRLPINSEILVPEVCFSKKTRSRSSIDLNENKSDNIDCLLQCKLCKLTVHQNCYFGCLDESKICSGGGPIGKDNWLCEKCNWKNLNVNEPQCCLCLLYGGALKLSDDKQNWAHITCAMCVESVSFKEPSTRTAINIPKNIFVKEKKQLKKCIYCSPFTQFRTSFVGLTTKCEIKTCKNRFHATCGYLYGGCYFDYADWPRCVSILCHEHANTLKDELLEKRVRKN